MNQETKPKSKIKEIEKDILELEKLMKIIINQKKKQQCFC